MQCLTGVGAGGPWDLRACEGERESSRWVVVCCAATELVLLVGVVVVVVVVRVVKAVVVQRRRETGVVLEVTSCKLDGVGGEVVRGRRRGHKHRHTDTLHCTLHTAHCTLHGSTRQRQGKASHRLPGWRLLLFGHGKISPAWGALGGSWEGGAAE